jgi:AmpD protein
LPVYANFAAFEEIAMRVNDAHWLDVAVHASSEHCDDRPEWAGPELIVVHCVSLPEDEFGTGAPTRLFTGCLDTDEDPSFADLAGVRVAPHVLIERDGRVTQFVPFDRRAWHAGVSCWHGRDLTNDYSIGIELEGSIHAPFTDEQYRCLTGIIAALLAKYDGLSPDCVVGHSEIAPGRKLDPGPHFDWAYVLAEVHRPIA